MTSDEMEWMAEATKAVKTAEVNGVKVLISSSRQFDTEMIVTNATDDRYLEAMARVEHGFESSEN